MGSEQKSDEEVLQALATLSAQERDVLNRVLARLAAAETVCGLLRTNFTPNFTPKRRTADKGKRAYWWDVAIALREWEKVAKP